MYRPLAAVLAMSAVSLIASTTDLAASPRPDGARGTAILRLRGGTVYSDPDRGGGQAWLAGGGVGVGVTRDCIVSANFDHLSGDLPGARQLEPMTIQLELGRPFQHRVAPRLEVGAGVYLNSPVNISYRIPVAPVPLASQASETVRYGRTDAPFGMNMGGGVSFLLSSSVMFDLGARYHQTMGSANVLILTTVTAGLTFALSKEQPDSGEYVQSGKRGGAAYAQR
jgi:opacity protein-like surface antigen